MTKNMKSMWTDKFGGVYTADKKRLLKVPDVKRYRIAEGCEETDEHAFDDCKELEILYVPYTFSGKAADDTFNNMPSQVGNYCVWDRPYVEEVYDTNDLWYDEDLVEKDEYGVLYANEGRRLIMATQPELIGKDYVIPDGVVTICDGAFAACNGYTVLSAPRSIKAIGDYIFGDEGGKIVIRD